jgi:hypothetical protein
VLRRARRTGGDAVAVIHQHLGQQAGDLEADAAETRASMVPRPNTRTGTFSTTGATATANGRNREYQANVPAPAARSAIATNTPRSFMRPDYLRLGEN